MAPIEDHDRALCRPGEMLGFVTTAGGGYGQPSRREPARVAAAVNRGWLSQARAEEVYAVVLRRAENGIEYLVDEAATARRRA